MTQLDKAVMPELLDIREAAQRLSLSPWTIRAYYRKGQIHAVKVGKRVLIPRSEIERIAEKGLPSLAAQ